LDDAGGAEIDISNGLGIIQAVRKAKSVRIILVIDYADITGGKMKGVKKLAHTIASVVKDFAEDHKNKLDFIFTKVPPNKEKSITNCFKIALEETVKKEDKDEAAIQIYEIIADIDNPLIIDPSHSDRKNVLTKLFKNKEWITSPDLVFQDFATETSMPLISEQLLNDKSNILKMVTKFQNNNYVDENKNDNECENEIKEEKKINVQSGIDYESISDKLSELKKVTKTNAKC